MQFGLEANDFISPGDKSALDALRGIEPIPRIVNRLVAPDSRKLESWLARNALRVGPPSKLDTLVRTCGEVLGLDSLPRAYVAPFAQMNAFTTGTDDSPILVICAPLLDRLGYAEMEGLVAHELAHVRSKHVLYHSLAESLATGAQFVATQYTTGLIGLPIRMLLLSWYRESEVSADRAAILVLGGCVGFESLMAKLMASTGGDVGSLGELMQTHPTFENRVRQAREFSSGNEFRTVRARMTASRSTAALARICGYCGVIKPRSEVFCPNCAHSDS